MTVNIAHSCTPCYIRITFLSSYNFLLFLEVMTVLFVSLVFYVHNELIHLRLSLGLLRHLREPRSAVFFVSWVPGDITSTAGRFVLHPCRVLPRLLPTCHPGACLDHPLGIYITSLPH